MQLPEDIENTVSVLKNRYTTKRPYIYWLLLALVISIVLMLPFISVDISSSSQGVVRQKENNMPLTTIVSGQVVYSSIENNAKVNAGDTLLLIDNTSIHALTNEQQKLLSDIELQISDLESLCSGNTDYLQTLLYSQEFVTYTQRIKSIESQNQQYKREYERAEQAYKEGLLSEKDYDTFADQYNEGIRNLNVQQHEQMSTWQKTLRQLKEQRQNLRGELQRTYRDNHNYLLIAPISGTLVSENAILEGAYVTAGQVVCVVLPDDSLIVECYVSPSDIGFIEIGQEAKLQYSAFNYNQWGVGHGVVYDIDKNLSVQGEMSFFVVRCMMKESSLFLKNGYEARIKKGMFVTAHFQLTRRTLWQLLWDKADDWFNPEQKGVQE